MDLPRFKYACTGGTYGPLHEGHKRLLLHASTMISDDGLLVVRLTSDEYLYALQKSHGDRKHFGNCIPSYDHREEELYRYLYSICRGRFEIFPLDKRGEDCGECKYGRHTEAIIVGDDGSKKRADQLNAGRPKSGLCGVKIVVVAPVLGDGGERISSTNIRAGLIMPDGKEIPPENEC